MFKTGIFIGPAAARSFVALCELFDARKLDETERSAAAELFFEAGNQIGLEQLLDGRKRFFVSAVRRDGVVERIGAFNQNRDVVLGKCLGDVFDNIVAAAACITDESVTTIAEFQHLDNESDQEQQNDNCSKNKRGDRFS